MIHAEAVPPLTFGVTVVVVVGKCSPSMRVYAVGNTESVTVVSGESTVIADVVRIEP